MGAGDCERKDKPCLFPRKQIALIPRVGIGSDLVEFGDAYFVVLAPVLRTAHALFEYECYSVEEQEQEERTVEWHWNIPLFAS